MNLKPGTKEYRLIIEEKGCSGELHTLGKIAYFIEAFYGITFKDEDIKEVLPVEKPTQTRSYQNGYNMGKVLVENGFTKEHCITFYQNMKAKLKAKFDLIEPTKKIK